MRTSLRLGPLMLALTTRGRICLSRHAETSLTRRNYRDTHLAHSSPTRYRGSGRRGTWRDSQAEGSGARGGVLLVGHAASWTFLSPRDSSPPYRAEVTSFDEPGAWLLRSVEHSSGGMECGEGHLSHPARRLPAATRRECGS